MALFVVVMKIGVVYVIKILVLFLLKSQKVEQFVIGKTDGESMATCINLTESRYDPSLPRQKAEMSTNQPSERSTSTLVNAKMGLFSIIWLQ